MTRINRDSIISFLALCALLTSCASAQKETITVEKKKGGVTVVHHRAKTSYGARDRIEAINAKGVVTQAEVKVYDVGRMPDGHGGMREAGRYYRIVKSPTFDLRLPSKSSNLASGPKTVFTPPNYSPPPNDQRSLAFALKKFAKSCFLRYLFGIAKPARKIYFVNGE